MGVTGYTILQNAEWFRAFTLKLHGRIVLPGQKRQETEMNIYRCRICGESYLGADAPTHCPYCGAHKEHLVDLMEYPETINDVNLTEIEQNDLLEAIELERSNTRFYLAMGADRSMPHLSSAYKRLSKIEAEHCELFCKLARVREPKDLKIPSEIAKDWCANIEESVAREQKAMKFYALAAERATNERIREVFSAVSSIEADHIALDGTASRIARC